LCLVWVVERGGGGGGGGGGGEKKSYEMEVVIRKVEDNYHRNLTLGADLFHKKLT